MFKIVLDTFHHAVSTLHSYQGTHLFLVVPMPKQSAERAEK